MTMFHWTVLVGLLVVDIALTGYGVWAFTQARKSCHSLMLEVTRKAPVPGDGV